MRAALARGVNNSGSDSENLQLMTAFTKPSSVLSFEFETFVYIFNISAICLHMIVASKMYLL